jgi:hypothetical protein
VLIKLSEQRKNNERVLELCNLLNDIPEENEYDDTYEKLKGEWEIYND